MIELRTLGAADLRTSAGNEVRAVLAQPKRFALLVYLALAPTARYCRRDTLLGLFWPESDQARARASLRQSVRFLRQAVGDGVIVSRGEEDVGLADTAVSCDALQFRAALARGDAERALQLYRGELLTGFFLPETPEFERWLEEERERLRRAAVAAAWTLSASAQAEGQMTAAASWARRATELSPTDEEGLRRLLSLLDAAGNRAEALEAYTTFAERMRIEYGLEPAPETRALVQGIRRREEAAPVTPRNQQRPALNPQRVLVDVFQNRTGDPTLDPLGSMAADWIAQGLSAVAGLEVVPLMATVASSRYASSVADEGTALDRVRRLADDSGAGTIVSGAFYAQGDVLTCAASVADASRMTILRALQPIAAPRRPPFEVVEQVKEQVVTEVAVLLDTRVSHTRATRPPSYTAYSEYVQALDLFINGAWRDALDRLQRATRADPTYVLPLIVSAIVYWNLGELREAERTVRRVNRRRRSLGGFERAVIDMVLGWLRGDWAAAYEAAGRQARLAPDSIPHYQTAEEARRLNRPAEALAILSRLDPTRGELRGFFVYWRELTQALHLLGRHVEELEAAARARELYPDHPGAVLLELRALAALGRTGDIESRLNALGMVSTARLPTAGGMMRETGLELRAHGQVVPAQHLFDWSVEWYRSRSPRERKSAPHRRELARSLYCAGRLADAQRLFEALSRDTSAPAAPTEFHHAHLHAHLDAGYLGVIAVRRRDRARAARIAARLARLDRPYLFGRHTYWRAAIAAVQGHAAEAAELLRHAFSEGMPFELFVHQDLNFESVRTSPEFLDVTKPKG
jgi:DNA-binding SARP family transcriptional activator